MITISLVIGMGIFRTASDVALAAGSPTVFFSAWIFGGLIALCGALSFAEIGARRPVTGGYYKIFAECYHPSIAFALNAIIIIANSAALAGIAIIGTDYLIAAFKPFYHIAESTKIWIAAFSILLFFTINTKGLKISAQTLNALMILKIGMLIMIIICQFYLPDANPINAIQLTDPSQGFIQSLGLALIAVCFTYGGYQHTINFGGEAQEAKSKIPQSIIIGVVCVIILYLGVNYAYYKVIGFENLKTATSIASTVGEHIFGSVGLFIFSILLFIGAQSYLNIMLMTNPRIMQAMAADQRIFKHNTDINVSENDPKIYLYLFTGLSLFILFWAETFDKILGFVMVLDSFGMALGAATLFYFRKKSQENIGYNTWWYPWATILFITSYLFVALSIAIDKPMLSLTGILVFAGLVIIYYALQIIKKKSKT